MTVMQGTALFSPGLTFGASGPSSIFSLLKALLDNESADPGERRDAVESLVAYHCATISTDKYTAVKEAFHIQRQTLLLLDYVWDVFGSAGNIFGNNAMPHSPNPLILSQIASTIAARRATQSLGTLPGPQS